MPQVAPPPPRSTHQVGASSSAPSLTAAVWNRRAASNGLAHWPGWLRGLPEAARPITLVRLFGALFMALPGLALVIFAALHAGTWLAVATLLLVATHATLHAVAARAEARGARPGARAQLLDAHAPALLLWTSLLPFVSHVSTGPALMLGASLALALGNAWMTARGRHRHWRRPLHAATALLLAATVAAQAPALPLPARAMLLAAVACLGLSVVAQLRTRTRRIAGHLLLVLGSVGAAIAVALQIGTANS